MPGDRVCSTPLTAPLAARLHAGSRILAAAVVVLGLAVLVGWTFDIAWLMRGKPGLATMKANTALLFVLIGVALLIAELPDRRALRMGLGVVVATVSGLTLFEYGFGLDFGIDQLLVRDDETPSRGVPGRMAPATAVNFLLLGFAVVLFDVPAVRRIRLGAVLIASAIAFVAVCGYLFGVRSLYSVTPYATVAVHTAVGFLVVASAYVLSPSQHFVDVFASDTVAGRLLRRILPVTLVVPVLVGELILVGHRVWPYGVEYGVSLVVLSVVLSLGSIAWIVSHRLYRSEVAERRVEARSKDVREREARYRALFDESPVALWEKDYTEAFAFLRQAVAPEQLRERLLTQPELVGAAAAKLRVIAVNRRGLALFGAENLLELAAGWPETFGPDSCEVRGELLALLDGQTHFETEAVRRTLAGRALHVRVQLTAIPDPVATRGIVSMVDITASKQAEQALREAVGRQEVLLREVHHRVKNNLAVIASLFYLESTHNTDARLVSLLEDSRRRIRSMALVHETLYRSDNLASIDMAQYAQMLASECMSTYRPPGANIRLTVDLQPVELGIDLAVPCGLILNELLSNAIKHAFPVGRSGVVHVSLRESGHDCVMSVIDDGVGLPADFDVVTHHSLGLRLVRLLAKQLRGTVEFRRLGPGTEGRVTFARSYDDG